MILEVMFLIKIVPLTTKEEMREYAYLLFVRYIMESVYQNHKNHKKLFSISNY